MEQISVGSSISSWRYGQIILNSVSLFSLNVFVDMYVFPDILKSDPHLVYKSAAVVVGWFK